MKILTSGLGKIIPTIKFQKVAYPIVHYNNGGHWITNFSVKLTFGLKKVQTNQTN